MYSWFGLAPFPAPACGPFFPDNILGAGDDTLLKGPLGDFARELERMGLGKSRFAAVPPPGSQHDQAGETELADLQAALRAPKTPKVDALRIQSAHELNRARLNKYINEHAAWAEPLSAWRREESDPEPPKKAPSFPDLPLPEGLPGEFADYFTGAMAWHNAAETDKSGARNAWEKLLARPEAERKFKSTWAAFMLGRYWETNNAAKAIQRYQEVRQLAAKGFKDSSGLAVASFGREALVELKRKHYKQAIHLYLDQLAADDDSAADSLKFVAAEVFATAPEPVLADLAGDSAAQRVLTTYLISQPCRSRWIVEDEDHPPSTGLRWLNAVETARIRDVDSAEKLALAAYQENQMAIAARWIKRAPGTPLSQWIGAKLLMHEGKLAEAAKLLSKLVQAFPPVDPSTNAADCRLPDHLYGPEENHQRRVLAWQRVRAELGALQLARSDYVSALDNLLQAGFWEDAAYVGERVLTLDELKGYVDRCWPPMPGEEPVLFDEYGQKVESETSPRKLREQIRYLLARRLTRELRGNEAEPYYPDQHKPAFQLLSAELLAGWNEAQPQSERARSLFRAAWITRTNGLDLLATELAPDYAIHSGSYDWGLRWQDRATNNHQLLVRASTNEIARASAHHADPEQRYHYRYQAASLAWQAALLMPNNNEETALMLWAGGTWLKYRDPDTADIFYKALVNRNRRTELGTAADQLRWFPLLDEGGHPLPPKEVQSEPLDETEMNPAEEQQEGDPGNAGAGGFDPHSAPDYPSGTVGNSSYPHNGR